MLEVMERFKPDVVFHAAAYKHVPLMEANPLEAVRNNALATQVAAKTAAAAGAERFVLVSTDKAVNPRTVMGASKAIAEWIVEAAGQRHPPTRFTCVRFGNVLASSGSVVPRFRSQIEQGGPVTVTHPEMSRYFMTIPEAVQLVIQAGDLGSASGDVFVLEMGDPVRIVDLARNMIRLAGLRARRRDRDRVHRPTPGREDPRGALQSRRAPAGDRRRPHRPRRPQRPSRRRLGREHPRAAGGDGRRGRRGRSRRAGRGDRHRRAASRRSRTRRIDCRASVIDLIEQIGPILGIVAFVGLAVLAFLIFQQGREVRRLREWAGRAPERAEDAADASLAAAEARGEAAEEPSVSRGPIATRLAAARERIAAVVRASLARARPQLSLRPALPGRPGGGGDRRGGGADQRLRGAWRR